MVVERGVVPKQRQKLDQLVQAFQSNHLDLVRPYELLSEEFMRQLKAQREETACQRDSHISK